MGGANQRWHVYVVECADGTLYTGITMDPQRRVKQHNAGRAARYTRTRGPVHLLGYITVGNRADALRLERRVKKWKPARKRSVFVAAEAQRKGANPQS